MNEVYCELIVCVVAPSIVCEDVVAIVIAFVLLSVFFTVTALPVLPTAVYSVTVKAPPEAEHFTSTFVPSDVATVYAAVLDSTAYPPAATEAHWTPVPVDWR